MASLKELRDRIASVKATQKITKAMRMVAVAKLRLAQESAEAARPYADEILKVIANLILEFQGQDTAPPLMSGTGKSDQHLVIVCTTERGLCGGLNGHILKASLRYIRNLTAEGKDFKILCVGRKGYDGLKRDYASKILDVRTIESKKSIPFAKALEISTYILELFKSGRFDICVLCYARFKSVIAQIPVVQQVIPYDIQSPDVQSELVSAPAPAERFVYEYEPNQADLLEGLLVRNLSVQIFRALLENFASEQGARMSAMDSATRNAGEMIDKLTLSYNRERQAKITSELIEIISGAEAL